MQFAADLNPYDVPDDHPAVKLRFTKRAYKDWIARVGFDPVTKGNHLAQLWKRVLLRRTHSSCIPFKGGQRVREHLPRVKAAVINCSYNHEESVRHKALEDDITGVNVVTKSLAQLKVDEGWTITKKDFHTSILRQRPRCACI